MAMVQRRNALQIKGIATAITITIVAPVAAFSLRAISMVYFLDNDQQPTSSWASKRASEQRNEEESLLLIVVDDSCLCLQIGLFPSLH